MRKTNYQQIGLWMVACALLTGSALGCSAGQAEVAGDDTPHIMAASTVAAGKYLITIGGCNDCHTDGYLMTEGDVPEEAWLAGSPVGWRGPWGTTYAPNLRLRVQELTEDEFVATLKERKAMPPMPWMNVNQMSESDARSIYQYIRSLGPVGEPMPTVVPPDQEPTTPYISLQPVMPPEN